MNNVTITLENKSFHSLYSREFEGFVLYYREVGDGFVINREVEFYAMEDMFDFIASNISTIIPSL